MQNFAKFMFAEERFSILSEKSGHCKDTSNETETHQAEAKFVKYSF